MGHKVLLVDDDKNLLDGLRRALRKEPYEIVAASSAEEALGILGKEAIDVVVSDQDMPGMSGTVFLAAVRQRFPDTVRFMLTGKATLDTAVQAINDGAISRFFTKPCNNVDLAVTIRQALQQKELMCAARGLLNKVKHQDSFLAKLEKEQPGITQVNRDEDGLILLRDTPDDPGELLREISKQLDAEELVS